MIAGDLDQAWAALELGLILGALLMYVLLRPHRLAHPTFQPGCRACHDAEIGRVP